MEMAANLTIQNDAQNAKEHYNKAQKLLPQIQEQKEALEQIQSKDLQFKIRIDEILATAKKFVIKNKEKWMDPEF